MCDICGGDNLQGCHSTGRRIDDVTIAKFGPLSVDDWREVYDFMRFIYLPFIHRIVSRARSRQRRITGRR